jgi:hypothetical protein
MATKYKPYSNYALTKSNGKYLELYEPSLTRDNLNEETTRVVVQSKYNRRIDLFAKDYLSDHNSWWVIVHYNREKLKDPINDFIAGMEVVIPKRFRPAGNI